MEKYKKYPISFIALSRLINLRFSWVIQYRNTFNLHARTGNTVRFQNKHPTISPITNCRVTSEPRLFQAGAQSFDGARTRAQSWARHATAKSRLRSVIKT